MARRRWVRDPWTVLVAALASYRITRLVVTDRLPPVTKAREAVADRMSPEYAELLECPWCLGFWTSGLVAAAAELAERRGRRDAFLLAALPWAISTISGLLADREVH